MSKSLVDLRKAIASLGTTSISNVVLVSAAMIILKNGRLGNLGLHSSHNEITLADIRQVIATLNHCLKQYCPTEIAQFICSEPINDTDLKNIWQALSSKRLDELWLDETTLGYIYQFLCLPERKFAQTQLVTPDKVLNHKMLSAFTQLYTPGWIADFLVTNTVIPQWKSRPNDLRFTWLIENSGSDKLSAQQLTVMDPAVGAGHLLVKSFNLLTQLYLLEGLSEKEAAQTILQHNLFGADIDKQALAVTALSLITRALKSCPIADLSPVNLAVAHPTQDKILGSLGRTFDQDHLLNREYRCVVTNPPYIGRKLLDRHLKELLKTNYPSCHSDLAFAFVERCLELTEKSGRIGLITQASLLSLPSYKQLRKHLLTETCLSSVVELGPGAFPLQSGEKINSVLLVVERASSSSETFFVDLTKSKSKEEELKNLISTKAHSDNTYRSKQITFLNQPNQVINYRSPAIITQLLTGSASINNQVDIRQGLATTDNNRFLRYWWDVDDTTIGQRWFPYVKGAGMKRWHGAIKYFVNWQDNGAEIKQTVVENYPYLKGNSAWVVKNEQFYFQEGLTFSFIGSKDLSVRYLPEGCIFDVGGSAIFAKDKNKQLHHLLAYLNSSLVRTLALNLNPSINFQVGDLKRLPLIDFTDSEKSELSQIATECLSIQSWLDDLDPAYYNQPPSEVSSIVNGADIASIWQQYKTNHANKQAQLAQLENRLDKIVIAAAVRHWQLSLGNVAELNQYIQKRLPKMDLPSANAQHFAHSILHHLLRHRLTNSGWLLLDEDASSPATILELSEQSASWLSEQLKQNLGDYLRKGFFERQKKLFSGSPEIFSTPLNGNGKQLIFSSATIRSLVAGRTRETKSANAKDKDTASLEMLDSLAKTMSSTRDWTGAQLLGVLV